MVRDYGHSVSGLGPKQSAAQVAGAIIDCLRRPRPEVFPLAKARALPILSALAPGLADKLVRRERTSLNIPTTPTDSLTLAAIGHKYREPL